MITFTSARYGIQAEIPDGWSTPPTNWLAGLAGLDRKLIFRGPSCLMQCDVRALPREAAIDDREAGFRNLARVLGHSRVRMGRIQVASKDHRWARYRVGREAALSMFLSREMLVRTKQAYAAITGPVSLEQWVDELYASGVGAFVKTYFVVLEQKELTVNCSLGVGTAEELDGEPTPLERTYDSVVSSMKSSAHAVRPNVGPLNGTSPFDGAKDSYDLFLSYSSSNANTARAIADQLIADGIDPWFAEYMIHFRDERQAFQTLMERGLLCSRKGFLLLNPPYTESEHCLHELNVLTARLPPTDLFAVCQQGIEWPPRLPPLPAIRIASNSTHEVLRFAAQQLDCSVDPTEAPGAREEPGRASCFGIPFTIDLTGWHDVQHPDIVAPNEPERGFSAMLSTRRGMMKMTLAHGGLEEKHDPSSLLNGTTNDRDLYEHALDWVLEHTDRYGHSVRGVHLVHLNHKTHLAVTYHSGVANIWMRKYAIILSHPAGRSSVEFVFSFGSPTTFRNFLGMASAMEQVVLSLHWPDMSAPGIADMNERAERLAKAGRREMAEELRSIARRSAQNPTAGS